jgi:HlyD family secretion protein
MANATLPNTARPFVAKPRRQGRRWLWIGLLVVVAAAGVWGGTRWFYPSPEPTLEPRAIAASVGALGRLAPAGEVIAVAPPTPTTTREGGRVAQLLVEVGDSVKVGQIVAILDTRDRRAAIVDEAQAKVEVARAKVTQVQAGAKPAEIKAQEAVINRSAADLVAAQEDYERANHLIVRNAIAKAEHSSHRLKFEQAKAALAQAKAQLEALKSVRAVDVKVAEAELAQAEANLAIAWQDLKDTEVRSPVSGRVLRIHARPGEEVKDKGILEVGNTDVMHVVAEVYEEDVGKVRVGQAAKVSVPTLGEEPGLSGEVVSKNLIVARQDIFDNDPVADIDARVVEVRIRLSPEDSAKVAGLSNARAEVVIDVSGGTP